MCVGKQLKSIGLCVLVVICLSYCSNADDGFYGGDFDQHFIGDPVQGAGFGHAVEVAGEGGLGDHFVVIGAPNDDGVGGTAPAKPNSGAVYIQWLDSNGWHQIKFTAGFLGSDEQSGAQFGFDVAVSHNPGEGVKPYLIFVGAPTYTLPFSLNPNANQGKVYVYTFDPGDGTLTFLEWVTDDDAQPQDEFGYALDAVVLNGLQEPYDVLLAVGSPGDDDTAGADQGKATIFARDPANPQHQKFEEIKTLFHSSPMALDRYAHSLSMQATTNDFEGNVIDMVVGVPFDDFGPISDQGSMFEYKGDPQNWVSANPPTVETHFHDGDGEDDDRFGWSVDLIHEIDPLALWAQLWIVAGVPNDYVGAEEAGSVRVYKRVDNVWSGGLLVHADSGVTQGPYFVSEYDHFGWSVSWTHVTGAITADSLIVGAPWDDVDEPEDDDCSRVFRFNAFTSTNLGRAEFIDLGLADPPIPQDFEHFGFSVFGNSSALAIGSVDRDETKTDQGAVFYYIWCGVG